VFATLPPFEVCVLLFGLWGLSTAMIFWSAMIKATRNWGGQHEQGRAFGLLEGGSSVTDLTAATVILAIFAFAGADREAFVTTLIIDASCALVLGVIVWLVMKEDKAENVSPSQPRMKLSDVRVVLRMPVVWLLATIILAGYSGMWGAIYLTPFASDIFELGSVQGGAVGVAKYWIAPIAAVIAGLIADRIGTDKAVIGSFVLMTAGFLVFAIVPGGPGLVPLLLVTMAVIACGVFALRGIYFALMEQGNIPLAFTGTAAGLVSIIGYTPDIFVPLAAGAILDVFPGRAGYQVFFSGITAISIIGLIAACLTYRLIRRGAAVSGESPTTG
jgi:nitrate/nitrite transporter NarK